MTHWLHKLNLFCCFCLLIGQRSKVDDSLEIKAWRREMSSATTPTNENRQLGHDVTDNAYCAASRHAVRAVSIDNSAGDRRKR